MQINKFISSALDELQDLKSNNNKKRYVIEELEFDLSVTVSKENNNTFGINILMSEIGLNNNTSQGNIQRVKIKLKPKE
jgi:hypothetical protein